MHSAVCSPPATSVNFSVSGANYAGVVDTMPAHLRERAIKERYGARTVAVPCSPLHELMRRHGLASADLLSLDVEGAEIDITDEDTENKKEGSPSRTRIPG